MDTVKGDDGPFQGVHFIFKDIKLEKPIDYLARHDHPSFIEIPIHYLEKLFLQPSIFVSIIIGIFSR